MRNFWNEYHWYIVIGVIMLLVLARNTALIERVSYETRTRLRRLGQRQDRGARDGSILDAWRETGILAVVIFTVIIEIILFTISSGFRGLFVGKLGWVIGLHIAFILAATSLPYRNVWKPRLAKVVMGLALIIPLFLINWNGGPRSSESPLVTYASEKNSPGASREVVIVPPTNILPVNETNKVIVEKFWLENIPEADARVMIGIASKETNFNQFELDGTTPYRGRQNSGDVGIHQIHELYWRKTADKLGPDYNIDTLEGNLKMSLWLYNHYGPWLWTTYSDTSEVLQVIAPVGDLGNEIKVPGPFAVIASGPIWIRTSDGRLFCSDKPDADGNILIEGEGCGERRTIKKGEDLLGNTESLTFKSREDLPVKVTVYR